MRVRSETGQSVRKDIERPIPGQASPPGANAPKAWGSDAIAEAMRALDVPYVALNPGASYRGLHDSIVNHLGNDQP